MTGLLRSARLVASFFVTAGLVLLATATPQVTAQQGGTTIITVTVQDSTGAAVKNAGVNVHSTDFKKNFFSGSDATGVAVVQDSASQVAVGDSLVLDVFPPFDSAAGAGLIAPDTVTLGAYSGTPFASRTVQFKAATKTLNIEATTTTGALVTSVKVNVFKESGGFAQATTDAAGKATVKLSGGRWNLHAEPGVSFAMTGPPVQVTFKDDTSVETQTVKLDNFVSVNAKVIGKVVTADGSALPQGTGIGINSGPDFGAGAPIQSDGTFSVSVPGDRSFNLDIFSPPNPSNPNASQWGAPSIDPFLVKVGETKDLGTLTLQKKTAKITVKVKNGAAGMMAFAFSLKSHEFSNATLSAAGSDAEGTIPVLGGRNYMVMVMSESFGPPGQQQATINKVVKGGPQNVTLAVGGTGTLTFEALDADATLNVRVLKSTDSSVVKDSFGFLEVNNDEVGFLGKPIERGAATVRVPGGRTYTLNPMMPMGGFMPEGTTTVTPAVNSTNAVDIKMIPTDATFKVSFVKSDGTAATGIFAHAFAISNDGVNASGEFGGHGGAATASNISVVASKGPYRIGAFVEPGSGFAMVPPSDKYTLAAGETKEVKVTLKSLDSKIKGKVTDPDGNGVAGAFVKIDNGADDDQADSKGPVDHFFEFGGSTDKDGNYELAVTSNETHNVRVFLPPEILNKNGWLAAKEVAVKIGDKETKTGVDLKFRKADSEITGTITGSGPIEGVLVSGYSNDGAFNQVRTDSNGKYKMAATKGTVWHIDAAKDSGDKDAYFLTGEKLVDTTDKTSLTQDMDVTKQTDVLLPDVTRSGSSDNAMQISLKDGMNVQVPANALDEDNDGATATVTVSKTAELPSQEGGSPIGPGYDVTATASGEEIEKPNSSLTMTFPYKEADLAALGISEKDLANKVSVVSYDETTGAFRKEAGVVFDPDKNTATVSVDHMTVFGLTANADTTPPAAPSDVKATDLGTDGKIKVEWKNPTDSDFKSVKIYRSTTSGSLGTAVHTGVTGTSKEDTGLTNGTKYYYTVRSVDATGNESINTSQVSATPSKSSLPKTGQTIPSPLIWLVGVGLIALLYGLQRRHAR